MNFPEDTETLVDSYEHRIIEMISRPEVGAQAQFQNKKKPKKYSYDPSLSPNLDWAGKAEHLSFEVPTLPLFVHERLSTEAIINTLTGHRKSGVGEMGSLFADPTRNFAEQLKSYEHNDKWANRMILGDSLVVMNSLIEYEGMAGKVQTIFMDPPYGVKYNSNFQPFVRKKDVSHGDDDSFSREPEMVQAYRDTWELGIHSYLTYLRDRFKIARDLLTESGSIFIQISDENVHHVREILDEVFGAENFVSEIIFRKTVSQTSSFLPCINDYILWYGKEKGKLKYNPLYMERYLDDESSSKFKWIEYNDKNIPFNKATEEEIKKGKIFAADGLDSQTGSNSTRFEIEYLGVKNIPNGARGWRTSEGGIEKLKSQNRLGVFGNKILYKRFFSDFPFTELRGLWYDTMNSFEEKQYVVQTNMLPIQRCILMTTDPGDLVFDPTCGSGTTAYVAEQWGRRWITCDVSRVPLALARQRILTATFPWYDLKDPNMGPSGGYIYKRKQNKKGEEVGGLVPHITLKSIANDIEPEMEILVDRPEENTRITRVSGPFVVEATIPPSGLGEDEAPADYVENFSNHIDRMVNVLQKTANLQLTGGRKISLSKMQKPARAKSIHAEGESEGRLLAFHIGPENGAISERMVQDAIKEANLKNYSEIVFIGFAVQPNARMLIEQAKEMTLPAYYVQATPDFLMSDLLKNMRSSQVFSICGLPEVTTKKLKDGKWQVTLVGLDTFDPTTMLSEHWDGRDVPAWFLDQDYNGSVFHVNQAFFPRTSAWGKIAKALKTEYDESVWEHLAGNVSAPFEAGEKKRIAVKVIDERGNELMIEKEIDL
ncbi:MAG: site-specific DNA-methyltransferase [Leptospiraceae bacterium]|nr:site-specific DNA-methyltransferase [Leptospiraceae bacterium]